MNLKKMPFIYWDKVSIIEFLQRRIIINAIAYYELDNPLWSDREYDKEAKQLEKLMSKYKQESKQTMYWYCMYDFTSATGFDLYGKLNDKDKSFLKAIAIQCNKLKGDKR